MKAPKIVSRKMTISRALLPPEKNPSFRLSRGITSSCLVFFSLIPYLPFSFKNLVVESLRSPFTIDSGSCQSEEQERQQRQREAELHEVPRAVTPGN